MVGLESLKRKAISKDGVLVAVKCPGLKRSWAEVKSWHHGAGSESLKRAQEKLHSTAVLGDPSTLKIPVPRDNHQGQQLWVEWPEPRRQVADACR